MVPWGVQGVQKPWLKQKQHNPFGGHGGGNFGWGGGPPWAAAAAQWAFAYQQPQAKQRGPPKNAVPADFEVDALARYQGTVMNYNKWRGFGFLELNHKGLVPRDTLFVHWRGIQSEDRFPFLVKGLEVECGIEKRRDKSNWNTFTLQAKNVSLIGGTSIAMQDDLDAQKKEFVGGQHLRYTGMLKFYSPKMGFGYVTMDQGYDVDASVPPDLRVEQSEVNAGGHRPGWMENIAVEFGIWKTIRGTYKCYNMTLPGGHPLTQDAVENRISMGPQTYRGEVGIWNWRGGWGFIVVDPSATLHPRVTAKIAQMQQSTKQRGKSISQDKMLYFRRVDCADNVRLTKGVAVTFQLYIDDKGAGACSVSVI